jgi:hypothetical protein
MADKPRRSRRNFLWWCAGAVPDMLRPYPTEKAKYEGIGGAVLTTGVLAFFSGFYAIYTTVASGAYGLIASAAFGLLWAAAIFNLDRYIVSSLRKPTDPATRWRRRLKETWLPALPRLGLAILIGITLSKPLELQLFRNAVASQAAINRDQAVAAKRASLIGSSSLGQTSAELNRLTQEISQAEQHAKALEDDFRREADGTGGSRRYGYSEVARLKESAALEARRRATELRNTLQARVQQFQGNKDSVSQDIDKQVESFRQSLTGDFLTSMTALSDLTSRSASAWWISTFVVLLLIGIEITPVLVKLLSPIGPYDVKLDATNSAETHEALLQRDTRIRITDHHYMHVEAAERQADDTFRDLRATLADEDLHDKARRWKEARAAGAAVTLSQLVSEVRSETFTERTT